MRKHTSQNSWPVLTQRRKSPCRLCVKTRKLFCYVFFLLGLLIGLLKVPDVLIVIVEGLGGVTQSTVARPALPLPLGLRRAERWRCGSPAFRWLGGLRHSRT